MKTFAALIAGLLLSLTTFVAGLAIALTFLNVGEPEHRLDSQNTAALWPAEPVAVDKASQSFERLPARPLAKEQKVAVMSKAGIGARAIESKTETARSMPEDQEIDPVTTGAIEPQQPDTDAAPRTWKTVAHVEWCSRRYRSYSAKDNSYRPYGGGRRACQSPYSIVAAEEPADIDRSEPVTATAEEQPATEDEQPIVDQVALESAPDANLDSEEHVMSCFARYRSYRPEDNSYQPFDGGPRRQCR